MTTPPSAARRGLAGAALLVMLCGAAAAQVQPTDAADRAGVGQPAQERIGIPTNPEPITTVAPDERLSNTTLYLAAGRVDTSERKDAASLARSIRDADVDERMVIQLDGPMTPERKQRLADAGIQTLGYIPSNAFIIRPAGADADKAAALDFVVWHSPFVGQWKSGLDFGTRQFATDERKAVDADGRMLLHVTLFADAVANDALATIVNLLPDAEHHLTQRYPDGAVLGLTVDRDDVATLKSIPEVQFVEEAPEITFRNATTTWIIQSNQSNQTPIHDQGLRGEGQLVAVSDGRVDVNHCSFSDTSPIGPSHRKIEAYNTSLGADFHGTHVAGTAVGDNGAPGDTRGIAYEGRFVFDTPPSFSDAASYNMFSTHHNQGARVHTNSWGNDGTTAYDGLPRGIDRFSYDFEDSLVLFAVTNTSQLRNPENAKNVLAVGATQDTPNQANHCTGGVGPTSDGRRKPEIYAPGCGTRSAASNSSCSVTGLTGTSMACPAVAGAAMLVREYYEDGFYPTGVASPADAISPTGALVKATLLNSTVDMTGVSGFPSNLEGWGRLTLDNALHFAGDDSSMFVDDVRNVDGLSTGQQASYSIDVTSSSEPLNITLVWTEPPAVAGAGAATINDLDLRVTSPGGDVYLGNVFSGGQSTTGGTADDKNNVESVRIAAPLAGGWTVEVIGAAINQGTQGYGLVVNGAVNQGPLPLAVTLNSPLPDTLERLNDFNIELQVLPGDDTLVPGSVRAFVADDGVNFTSFPLTETSPDVYAGTIGPFDCDDTPRVYFEAQGQDSGLAFASGATQSAPHEIEIGELVIAADDDFEEDRGWTVTNIFFSDPADFTGAWERVNPQPTAAQPGSDTTPGGSLCFVTDGTAGPSLGSFDIDEGATILTSPAYDLSGLTNATVRYNRWYSNDTGAAPNSDVFTVEVSNDNGVTWTTLEVVGPAGPGTSGGWIAVEYQVEDFISLTDQVRFRFIAEDAGAPSLVEAALDDFRVDDFVCDATAVNICIADFDNNGIVDLSDFGTFGAAFGSVAGDANYNPDADFDNNGIVDLSDFGNFGSEFGRTDCLQ